MVIEGGIETVQQAKYCILEMNFEALYENSPLFHDIYCIMSDMGFKLIGLSNTLLEISGKQLQVDGIFESQR